MRKTETIRVNAGRGYDVKIAEGLLADCGEEVAKACPKAKKAAVVCDEHLMLPWCETVCASLYDAGLSCGLLTIRAGEANKTLAQYGRILEFLAEEKISRTDVLVALGGGMTGDMAGFAAATYLRGIDCVQIPTSLLAMVDSSVGGKTAVDLPSGKNLAGAFHQPALVLCDPLVLRTLPESDFSDGMAEVIKYGVLGDPKLFAAVRDCLLARAATPDHSGASVPGVKKSMDRRIAEVIASCVRDKQQIVEMDEFDRGERMKLNLGHTVGHAIELCSGYEISHGRAVAAGLAIICRAAASRGLMPQRDAEEVCELLRLAQLPAETSYSVKELAEAALSDKKLMGGILYLIVPSGIGACGILPVYPEELPAWIEAGL
ncbi:MAG: 3-dehydroquinate synthase [Clostridia bacterium]|nr:3-dehydroquinate synthase [Clostridia bacterium]